MERHPYEYGLAIALAALFSLSAAQAEMRAFTSNDGKTITAELVDATASNVTLKLEDGSAARVPLNRLSTVDQDYVNAWISSHPAAIRYGFTVDWDKERIGGNADASARRGRTPIFENYQSELLLHFKITNRAAVPLMNVSVKIKVYERTMDNKDSYMTYERTIPKMAAGETIKVDSDAITLNRSQFRGGSSYSGNTLHVYVTDGPTHAADTIRGYQMTISHAGRQVYTTASSGFKGTLGDR